MSAQVRHFDEPLPDLDGASVLVTGGTGSFGRAFVRRVLHRCTPKRLIVFSRDEAKQYEMAQLFGVDEYPCMRYFIGDVRNVDRLEMAMREVDYVIHAAALKQVPAAEYNPFECVMTNIHGAENVVKASLRARVRKVIALSTDKAANPVNLYGATKLASDKIFVAANNLSGAGGARFSVVRYGNVIDSRCSVIPLFKQLLRDGATTLPITDEKMTRFWITLGQGVEFVLSSLALMQGGEIFVPKIPSMRVVDVARALSPNVAIEVIGIRPGEKLHEVMITEDDARTTRELPDRYMISPLNGRGHNGNDGGSVGEGFRYSSDTNVDWLDADGLRHMVEMSRA
ncbi:MAG: UDP-N-acetylglucosamine 4,6-dehydratase (inverting) [Alphaproteobacteria bacterium]